MIRLCVLGNSHVASLKTGWDIVKQEYEHVVLTFFAQTSGGLNTLKIKDKCLVPDTETLKEAITFTSGGLGYIDPESYDHFLIYGLGLNIYQNSDLFYSKAVMEQALTDHLFSCVAFKLLKRLRQITHKPIYLGHCPLMASQTPSENRGDLDCYNIIVNQMCGILFENYKAIILNQPEETIVNGFETGSAYSIGATKLEVNDKMSNLVLPQKERTHMNDKFGAIYLRKILNNLPVNI